MAASQGQLYVVATPIGHLGDITRRAVEVLAEVDCVLAEDTRRSRQLLNHLAISKPLLSLHEHNEREQVQQCLERIGQGQSLALVSDAGTPLISDPGYHLVRSLRQHGIRVVPIPGASALVAALSVAGMPTDHFCFEGFLPHKRSARQAALVPLSDESRTLVFYESSHRIVESLEDMATALGDVREAVICRELTKTFETILTGSLAELKQVVQADPQQQKGEFVVIVNGQKKAEDDQSSAELDRLLQVLLAEGVSVKQSSRIASQFLQIGKNTAYQRALVLQQAGR